MSAHDCALFGGACRDGWKRQLFGIMVYLLINGPVPSFIVLCKRKMADDMLILEF